MARDPDLKYCAQGHVMTILGGANCGCYPDATCSVPVFSCRECGDSDYGDNEIADMRRAECVERHECMKKENRYEDLPPMHLTRKEFDDLDEYSATHPTGAYAGTRWRRHDGAFDPQCKKPFWIIGEYEEREIETGPHKGKVGTFINWYVPVIRVDAPLGN